jgi:hypothetical protein
MRSSSSSFSNRQEKAYVDCYDDKFFLYILTYKQASSTNNPNLPALCRVVVVFARAHNTTATGPVGG